MNKNPKMKTNLVLSLFLLCFRLISCSDNKKLVYKGCAEQKFQDQSGSYAESLKSLYDSLLAQSSTTNFSKTTAGAASGAAIFGLYQCRGDLSSSDCADCVSQFPKLAKKLCGDVIAVRIQLVGCYMRYEVVGFRQVSSTELLYKECKAEQAAGGGFEARRESAFQEVESGVVSGGGGFYAASFGDVYAMGQCEGDLVGSDCGDCVKTGLERVKAECGDSMSGQVYLNECYVSYSYYPNGVGTEKTSTSGTRHNTARTVAIVVGGTTAAGFGVVILLCIRSGADLDTKFVGGKVQKKNKKNLVGQYLWAFNFP